MTDSKCCIKLSVLLEEQETWAMPLPLMKVAIWVSSGVKSLQVLPKMENGYFITEMVKRLEMTRSTILKIKTRLTCSSLGNAIPKYFASWTHNFSYKNFDLRIFLRGKFDYKILNTTALTYGNKTWSGNLLKDTFTKYNEINDTYMYSDYYLEERYQH